MKTSLFILFTLAGLLITAGCASEENGQGGSYGTAEHNQGQVNSTRGTGNFDRGYWDQGYYYPY